MLVFFQRLVALFYAYGAAVHVANLSGFGPEVPVGKRVPFRILDITFLILDVVVVLGLWRNAAWGLWAFFVAAGAQVVMYLGFADYFTIEGVPAGQLRGLVWFHLVTMSVMVTLLFMDRLRSS